MKQSDWWLIAGGALVFYLVSKNSAAPGATTAQTETAALNVPSNVMLESGVLSGIAGLAGISRGRNFGSEHRSRYRYPAVRNG